MANDMSGSTVGLAASVSKAKLGSDIITGTLDKLNSGSNKSKLGDSMKQSYDFNKEVLSAVYGGKGTIADGNG